MQGRKHAGVLALGFVDLFAVSVGIELCVSATHVTDLLAGLALIWLSGSAATCLLFSYSGRRLSAPLLKMLKMAVFSAGSAIAGIGGLMLAYGPDATGLTVALAFLTIAGLNGLVVHRITQIEPIRNQPASE